MKELFRKYAYHLDELREESGIKISDFCEGICEPRTYRYYTSGERIISQEKLNQFCKKLGYTIKEFINTYDYDDFDEYQLMNKLYFHIVRNEFDKAHKILFQFDSVEFENFNAKQLYDYCVIQYNYKCGNLHKEDAYRKFQELINYPTCLKKFHFNIQETLTIQAIARFEYQIGKRDALLFLEKFLIDPRYRLVSSNPADVVPVLFATVAYFLEKDKEVDRVIEVANRGIRVCKMLNTASSVDKLYYYLFFTKYSAGRDDYEEDLTNAIVMAYYNCTKEEFKKRIEIIKEDGIEDPLSYLTKIKVW